MSVTREDFFRLLPTVIARFETDSEIVRWSDGDPIGTIRLVPLPDHQLGGVAVHRHRVEIVLEVSDEEGEAFMARFRRAFLRGGG